MSKKFAVIGLGSAGIQSIAHYLYYLPDNWTVTSISDPNIPILGIGESTNPSFIATLESATELNLHDELKKGELNSTVKYGTLFSKWRDHEFINPLLGGSCALHIDTFALKNFSLPKFKSKWKNKFEEIKGKVISITDKGSYVSIVIDDIELTYDFVMDCRGIGTYDTDYTFLNNPTNHALIHNVKEGSDLKLTGHTATYDGWMFTVPLKHRTSYGYLFNNKLTSIDQAKENFSKQINVSINELDKIEYKYSSYYANNIINNRVCLNGTKAVFFEPMFANSLFIYEKINRLFFDLIFSNNFANYKTINAAAIDSCKKTYAMIAYFYHGGSTFNSPFWIRASIDSKKVLNTTPYLNAYKKTIKKAHKEGFYPLGDDHWLFTTHGLEWIDRNLNYNYFQRDI